MRTIVVFDDGIGDPIVDVVDHSDVLENIETIKLSDLILANNLTEDDAQFTGNIRARIGEDEDVLLVDRVIEVSPKTITAIGGQNTSILQGQVFLLYQKAIRRLIRPPSINQYSTVGRLLPLPTQWDLVEKAIPEIVTPEFVFTYGPGAVDYSKIVEPIHKTPFDLYNWKPNEAADDMEWDRLIVSKPTGLPVISYMVGGRCVAHQVDGAGSEISDELSDILCTHTTTILDLFGAQSGEVLWYVEGEVVLFAAFSHFLSGAALSEEFEGVVEAYIKGLSDHAEDYRASKSHAAVETAREPQIKFERVHH